MEDVWGIAKGVLGTVAPMLATAVGGPLAGQATNAIIHALGLKPGTTPAEAAQAVVQATPAQLSTIKQADADFSLQMRDLDIQMEQLKDTDRENSRDREVALKDWTPRVVAIVFCTGFFSLMGTLAFHDVPVANASALQILVGGLSAGVGTILGYYFGSSAGSAAKDMLLFKSAPAGHGK